MGMSAGAGSSVEVCRAADRFVTETETATTRHSFSFGAHYDPDNTGFGLLVAHNDDLVRPGTGYAAHVHVDTEIVTWVLSGSLWHDDARGHRGAVEPGTVQVLGAGVGVEHTETNHGEAPVRFVQTWLRPAATGLPVSYRTSRVEVGRDALVPVVSGRGEAAVEVRADATLYVARLGAGAAVALPVARWLHVFVAAGSVDLADTGTLNEGDAARLTSSGGGRLTAPSLSREAGRAGPATVLVWAMH